MEITLPAGKYTLNLTSPITFVQETPPPPIQVRVPSVIGKTVADAIITLTSVGLVLAGPTTGTVKTQTPVAGTLVNIGSTVTVTVEIVIPPTGTEIKVGPGQPITEIHQLPPLKNGDVIKLYYRTTPYKSKIVLNKSNVKLIGVPGPNGEKPIMEGTNAIEVPWATYWSSAVSAQGIISVVPGAENVKPVGVLIEGLYLRQCRQAGAGFTKYNGTAANWNAAAAGVALYRCEQVTIKNCTIEQCDNGVFGKSYGSDSGDLKKITLTGNTITACGVSGSDRQHNTYIEGIDTVYEFNNYWKPVSGSAGCNLKDRSAGAILRYNVFEGGARIIDLVDPEDGAPSFLQSPSWGKTYLYGNVIYNPQGGGSVTMIHFGYDGMKANEQKELYAYYNTIVNKNDRDAGGRWRTAVFKTHGTQKLHLADNIIHSFCPTAGHTDGDFFLATELPEENGSIFVLKNNFVVNHTQLVYIWNGAAFQGSASEWNTQIKSSDPGMVNVLNWDFTLKPDSICRNKAISLDVLGWPVTDKKPEVGWTTIGWAARTLMNVGVSE